ncbi:hypothetical protein A2229_00620 [Candidatus Peregrinibacteria bacterium RIFOXYA2_FULL_33_7]|nr:MAG: hypothetical protein A2229_00620 [Candidatus Peregrinibacteria bacterium RIFOXYA2_FULL_33_7]
MALSSDDVRKIAKLARLKLSEEEVKTYSEQMTSVLSYMDILNELDVSNVEPTFQVTGLTNVRRDDEIKKMVEKEDLLDCSNLPVERGQIKVKSVF